MVVDQRDAREGQARSIGVADGLVVPMKSGNAGGGKEPWFEEDAGRGAGQGIGVNLQTPESVQKLQNALHAKAKEAPDFRFYALYDKVYRGDILDFAYRLARSNRGAPGVDGQDFVAIESVGVERWLGELAQALKEKTYRTQAVRRVYIPKADGKQRPLGIPTVRDRVVQQAPKLVIEPIFEADFQESSYGFRPKKNATQALEAIRLTGGRGHRYVVEIDIEKFFDSIDHGKLLLLVEKNPSVLAAVFNATDAVEANFNTRVKMGQSSNVYAVAMMADGKVLFAQKEVKVTLGGCGG